MPLQDLNRITLHKTVIGITCPSCSGDLQIVHRGGKLPLSSLRAWLWPFPPRKTFNYQCNGCGHRFRMYRKQW